MRINKHLQRALLARSLFTAVSLLFCGFLINCSQLSAQVFTGTINGVVSDPTGAPVADAEVRVRELSTNEQRQVKTGVDGRYVFSQLKPGAYEVVVEAAGFKRFVQPNFSLNASQVGELNIPLALGNTSETVEVTASGPVLDTQTANKSVTLSSQAVLAAPTNVRNPLVLVWQTAGVVGIRTGISQGVNEQNQNRFSLNGGRDESSAILVDGVPSTSGDWGGAIATPSVEAVQEVQVIRTTYDTQYGRTDGGVVSMVTKSGSDQFHGNVYEYLRNSLLDANTWDNNRARIAKPSLQRHQFGATLGGFVSRRHHLYFFGSYEGLRDSTPSTLLTSVPTALERQGDFSQTFNPNGTLSTIYNPFSTRPNGSGSGYVRDPFPGNKIPENFFDSVGANVVNLLPLPNRAGNSLTNALNYAAGGKATNVNHKADIRVDWAKSEHYTSFVRVTKAWQDFTSPTLLGNGLDSNYSGSNPRHQVVIGNTFVPNPTWVTNILVGVGRWREVQISPSQGLTASAIGFPTSLASQLAAATIPQFSVQNYPTLSNSRYLDDPRNTYNLQINNTKQLQNHSLSFGFLAESQQVNSTDVNSASFSFNRALTSGPVAATSATTTGNAIASLLLGTGASGSAPNNARLALTEKAVAGYLQDTWRLNSRLTLNYGLRYEVQFAATERYNRLNNFAFDAMNPLSQTTGLALRGGLQFLNGSDRGQWDTDFFDFAPRVGVAYKITDKLVFRSGYGIYYPPTWAGISASGGYSQSTPWNSTVGGGGLVPVSTLSNAFPSLSQPVGSSQGLLTLVGQGVSAIQRLHPTPYVQSYSADLQYEFTNSTMFEVGYSGVQGRKLFYGYSVNQNQLEPGYLGLGAALNDQVPNPFYGQILSGTLASPTIPRYQLLLPYPQFLGVSMTGINPGASSSFNALTVKLNHRFRSGLQALITYQFSKAIDNASETQAWEISDNYRNAYDLSAERSISGHDVPQAFTASVSYEIPVGRGRSFGSYLNRLTDAIIGGWQVSTAVRFGSGLPLQFTSPNPLSTYGFGVGRPNITSLSDLANGGHSPDHWFNAAAVSAPGTYQIGTAPRWIPNIRTGPLNSADISLMKNFQITERIKLQLRGDAFNVSNTPQYGRADTSFGSTTFGQITSTTNVTPRNIQVAARVEF